MSRSSCCPGYERTRVVMRSHGGFRGPEYGCRTHDPGTARADDGAAIPGKAGTMSLRGVEQRRLDARPSGESPEAIAGTYG